MKAALNTVDFFTLGMLFVSSTIVLSAVLYCILPYLKPWIRPFYAPWVKLAQLLKSKSTVGNKQMYSYEYEMSKGGIWYSKETYESITDALDFGWHYARQRTKSIPAQGIVLWVRVIEPRGN